MKVKQVLVENYKPILRSGWVDIEDDVSILIGGNESGKTSFLEAIASFHDDSAYSESEICDQADPGVDRSELPIVTLEFEFESRDFDILESMGVEVEDKIIQITKFADGSKQIANGVMEKAEYDLDELTEPTIDHLKAIKNSWNDLADRKGGDFQNHFNQNIVPSIDFLINKEFNETELRDTFSDLETALQNTPEQNEEVTELKEEALNYLENEEKRIFNGINIGNTIYDLVPPIVYHSEFDIISDEVGRGAIDSDDHRTFRNFLDIVGIDHEEFDKLDPVERRRAVDKAEGIIEGDVNTLWEQKEVAVDLSYENNTFYALLKDEQIGKDQVVDRELRRPSERSKGFQWFFSFYINLTAQTERREDNTLILLDDPAVFLHPQGKRDWLDAIEGLSEKSQIVYSTHSPFLIKKEYPNRLRLVQDTPNLGSKITKELHEGNTTTLEPVRKSLGIGLGDSPFVSKRKILVEGSSDYYILIGVANYFKNYLDEDILDWSEVTVMPTNGGDQMIQAAKWVASEEFSYALLLDNDDKGKEIEKEIKTHHHDIDDSRVFLLDKEDGPDFHIEIEDMFAPEFYVDCVNTAYENQFGEWDQIEIEKIDEGEWLIENIEYKGRKIVSRLNDIFEDKEIGELDKVLVANEIRDRLNGGQNDPDPDIESFRPTLGKIRNVT